MLKIFSFYKLWFLFGLTVEFEIQKRARFFIFSFFSIFCNGAFSQMLEQGSTSVCPLNPVAITREIPLDTPINDQANLNCFAWQEFIGLNWSASISYFGPPRNTEPTVWETYMNRNQLMPQNGAKPPAWGTPPKLPEECGGGTLANGARLLSSTSKFSSVFQSPEDLMQAAPVNAPNWLADRDGNPVYYEILVNKAEYDYVTSNGLYDAHKQFQHVQNGQKIDLPRGSLAANSIGSIELKAAWLEVGDPKSWEHKYYKYKLSKAYVWDGVWDGKGHCEEVMVALVGLHIIHKTESNPQWVWATFEHVDNAPTKQDLDSGNILEKEFTFYNPHCEPQPIDPSCLKQSVSGCFPIAEDAWKKAGITNEVTSCAVNQAPSYCLDVNNLKSCPPYPTQVLRVDPISNTGDNLVATLNQQVQSLISEEYPQSVWQYYQLIGVLWSGSPVEDNIQEPSPPLAPLARAGLRPSINAIPLSNTTMETYVQAGALAGGDCSIGKGECASLVRAESTESCQTCHANAEIAWAGKSMPNHIPNYATDYSFVFKSAESGELHHKDKEEKGGDNVQ